MGGRPLDAPTELVSPTQFVVEMEASGSIPGWSPGHLQSIPSETRRSTEMHFRIQRTICVCPSVVRGGHIVANVQLHPGTSCDTRAIESVQIQISWNIYLMGNYTHQICCWAVWSDDLLAKASLVGCSRYIFQRKVAQCMRVRDWRGAVSADLTAKRSPFSSTRLGPRNRARIPRPDRMQIYCLAMRAKPGNLSSDPGLGRQKNLNPVFGFG